MGWALMALVATTTSAFNSGTSDPTEAPPPPSNLVPMKTSDLNTTTSDTDEGAGVIPSLAKGAVHGVVGVLGVPGDMINSAVGGIVGGAKQTIQGFMHPPRTQKEAEDFWNKFDTARKPANLPIGSDAANKSIETLGQKAGLSKHALAYENINDLPKEDRPWAMGGDVFASSVLPAAGILKAAKMGATGPAMLKDVFDFARSNPKAFMALEESASGGAAMGAILGQAGYPGHPLVQAALTIGGGFLSPFTLLTRSVVGSASMGGGLRAMFGGANDYKASKYLQQTLKDRGEDPAKVAAILKTAPDKTLTSGQISRSPTLQSMENQFAKNNTKFGEKAAANVKRALGSLQNAAEALLKTGKADAIQVAAKLKKAYFDKILDDHIDRAKGALQRAAAKLTPESKLTSTDVSTEAQNILAASLKEARGQERKLWSEIPANLPADTSGTMAAVTAAKAKYLPELSGPLPGMGDFLGSAKSPAGGVSWVDKPPEAGAARTLESSVQPADQVGLTWRAPKTTGELTKFRSTALQMSRNAQAAGDWKSAGFYSDAADGALSDLEKIDSIKGPLTNAREYSNALHDNFTRTFAGEALAKDRTGGLRIDPETMLRRSLGGGAEGAHMRFDQLLQAAKFGDERLASTMSSVQERYLRQNARKLVDPATGKVSATGLASFQRDNEALLNQFPNLKADYRDVETAQKAFDDAEALKDRVTKAMAQRATFSTLIQNEDPVYAVGEMLKPSMNPVKSYADISRFAKRQGPEAVAGLRTSTIESTFNKAFDKNGDFSWAKFKQNLTAPIGKGRVSTLDLMKSNGILDPKMADRLMEIVTRGSDIEESARGNVSALVDAPSEDMFMDLAVKMMTTKAAKAISKPWGASGLVVQGAGAKIGNQLMQKLPNQRVMDFIMDATQNPDTMAMLLEKPTTAQGAKTLMQKMTSLMAKGGYLPEAPFVGASRSYAAGAQQEGQPNE